MESLHKRQSQNRRAGRRATSLKVDFIQIKAATIPNSYATNTPEILAPFLNIVLVPTFHFYHKGEKTSEVVGADVKKLEWRSGSMMAQQIRGWDVEKEGSQASATDQQRSVGGEANRPPPHQQLLFAGGKEKGTDDVLLCLGAQHPLGRRGWRALALHVSSDGRASCDSAE